MSEVLEATIIEPNVALSVTVHPGELIDNFDIYKESALRKVEPFRDIDLSTVSVKEAKNIRAWLNSEAKNLESTRLSYERQYMAPFDVYKGKVKELSTIFNTEADRLGTVIKEAEEWSKTDRRNRYQAFYEDACQMIVGIVPFEKILDEKWLLKSYNGNPEDEILKLAQKIKSDWDTLRSLKLHEQAEVIFFDTLDLGQAIAENARLVEKADAIKALKVDMGLQEPITDTQGDNRTCVPIETEVAPQTGLERFRLEMVCPIEVARKYAGMIRDDGYEVSLNGVKNAE